MSMNKRIAGELVKIAAGLLAFEFPSEAALKEYLKVHPKADKRKHWVNKTDVETVKSDVPSSQTRVVPGSEDVFWNNKSDTVLGTMRSKPKTSKEDGGNHVNIVVFETYKDGSKGVFKPDTMDPDTLIDIRDNLDENVSQGKREVVSYKLDQVLGFNIVPPTEMVERDGEPGTVQAFVKDTKTAEEILISDSSTYKNGLNKTQRRDIQKIALFDYITGNTDRHTGNYLLDDKHVYAIDNGLTFPKDMKKFRSMPWTMVGGDKDAVRFNERLGTLDNKPEFDKDLVDHLAGVKREDFDKALVDAGFNNDEDVNAWDRLQAVVRYGGGKAKPEAPVKKDPVQEKKVMVESLKKLKDKVKEQTGKDLPPDKLLVLFKTLAKKGILSDILPEAGQYPFEGGIR